MLVMFLGVARLGEAQSTLDMVKERGSLLAGVKTDFPSASARS